MELFHNNLKMTALCNGISYSGLCADDCLNLYNRTLINLINQHCPFFEKTFQLDCSQPQWFKSSFKTTKKKNGKTFKKHSSQKNWQIFQQTQNLYNFELNKCREKYYTDNLSKSETDTKSLYHILNKLTGKKHEKIFLNDISHKNTADAMAKFYLKKIKNLRSLIELSHNGVSKFNIPVSNVNFNRTMYAV